MYVEVNALLIAVLSDPAFYGAVFPENLSTALIHNVLWGSFGSVFNFLLSSILCARTKIYISLTLTLGSLITMSVQLLALKRRNDREKSVESMDEAKEDQQETELIEKAYKS